MQLRTLSSLVSRYVYVDKLWSLVPQINLPSPFFATLLQFMTQNPPNGPTSPLNSFLERKMLLVKGTGVLRSFICNTHALIRYGTW